MFKSILGALLAHKHIVIAAIAITGIGVYAFPFNALLNQAQADHATIVNREIIVPCQPYCELPDREIVIEDPLNPEGPPIVHIQINFSLL
jgi:hypothetical protein